MSPKADSSAPEPSIVRARWVVLALLVALCAWLVPGISALRHDDDVLAFLPPEHDDVVAFREVADRFGMLEVALIGLRSEDPLLSPERTDRVRTLATRISELPGVRLVLAYPEFPEAKVEGDTLVVRPLVPPGTSDPDEIRRRVLSNPDAVGNFIAPDGEAAAIFAYLTPASGAERAALRGEQLGAIRATVSEHWDREAYYGGAPFMEMAASTASREDIERLSPIVIGVLVVASALLLGSITAAGLNLVITGLGVALIVGAHGRFGEPFTIVSSTTPVMMVALGGAFGMHMLAGFQRQAGDSRGRASATLRELWKPVLLSGLTTATAFFALLVMPQAPMQRFGVVAGVGVLILLVLALVALPALLAVLPSRWIPTRDNPHLPLRLLPPLWLVAVLGIGGAALGTRLQSEPDTTEMFAPDSEPRKADAFFNEHFGGSQFLQIAIEADLTQPVVLREIRDMVDELRAVEGVVDVRSLVDPVALLSEGFGGRKDIPETQPRTRRVITNLADQAAMKQLMVPEGDAAIIHVKLAPGGGEQQQRITTQVRAIVDAHDVPALAQGDAQSPALLPVVRDAVRTRLARVVGEDIDVARFDAILEAKPSATSMADELRRLRDRALGTDEIIEPVPDAEREAVDPGTLIDLRGKPLEDHLRQRLPTLVAQDAEGVGYLAEFLGQWIDDAIERNRFTATCDVLGLPAPPPPDEEGAEPKPETNAGGEGEPEGQRCRQVLAVLSELGDAEWKIPAGVDAPELSSHEWKIRLTGQPVIGQAFADSVTTSLRDSTLVSLGALALVLLVFGHLRALLPAVWTLMLTAGAISLLGHPISIGTSMVACIALGAGVDFAIHLGVRARNATDRAQSGREATEALGGVVLVTGVQLALAFLVLLASEMPPLQQFGAGLAIGLLGAAAGAVWLTPRLHRG
ncbi:MMPL family transporter [Paraliomyxa miuraensis]|uniref:MMPL family transporter n=1 Tax=Paraliomyxa miuraensis TaxID=376150 RepID=UPI00224EAC58|nr:MMPL family transporter [Paraliomyxa miuraensis]MCX4242900.1 MMPL family transporter [Paraliomyxa miuraensis]